MALAFWLVLSAVLCGAAQNPRDGAARPATPSAPGATIRGRVTAAAADLPLHRVKITLTGQLANPVTAVTDIKGVFELTDVPPGSYRITATRAGYLTIEYGQRRPGETGRTLDVESGEIRRGVDIALFRGGVLAGRIADEQGDPAPDVRVEAVELRYIRGRRVAVAARITATNDAGEYRLSGLQPGSYQVRASTTEVWEGDDGKNTYVYALTYFPGVTSAEGPQSTSLSVGQEVSGLDFRLLAGRAAKITGILEDARGEPLAGQVVNLSRITRTTGGDLMSSGFGGTGRTDAHGAFEFTKLAPGEFIVYSSGPTDRTSLPVTVNNDEVRDVVLTPRPPSGVSGSIATDEGGVPPIPVSRLRVIPVGADPASVLPMWAAPREQPPRPDWSFRIADVDGPYLFRVTGLPDEWMVKSVIAGGRDITDAPFTITRGGPDVAGVQIVLSRRTARVNGEVIDRAGAPAPDATVIVFGENPSTWGLASRFIKIARPDDRGRFSVAGLPPGIYRAIARDFVAAGQWEDADFLRGLLKDAVRLELGEGAAEPIKLTLERPR